ncbi:mechanosensitive ion channel family protein [Gemella cuniculi]|uniref:mechanosensitive ion channel family protein n=1 Tax=Gemella cuniculi TaxID=150240 RepID=UPI0003FBDB71|nr:mechanosensitive ion channel domain-containing protein [Gemella cuniculi]
MNFINEKIFKLFYNGEIWFKILEKVIVIIVVVLIAILAVRLLNKIIDYVMTTRENANKKFNIKINEKRSETLHKLVKSAMRYTIYFIAFFQILATLGVNTTSIVASAGIASVAIGFGAQSLVKDIISGFFIILEGQFDVGDNVKIYNQGAFIAGGNVLSLGLRSTKVRSKGGEIYFIPNGSINQVINYSLTYNLAVCEFPISILDSMDNLEAEVQSILNKVNLSEDYKKFLYKNDKLQVDVINKIEDNVAYITIVAKTKIGKKQSIETMLRRDFYNVFKERLKTSTDK